MLKRLGPTWGCLDASWVRLGAAWALPGGPLGALEGPLGHLRASEASDQNRLEKTDLLVTCLWALRRASKGLLEPCCTFLGAILGAQDFTKRLQDQL